jgi:hypothetical protein
MAYTTDYLDYMGGKCDECSEEDNDFLAVAELVNTVSSGKILTHTEAEWAMDQNENDYANGNTEITKNVLQENDNTESDDKVSDVTDKCKEKLVKHMNTISSFNTCLKCAEENKVLHKILLLHQLCYQACKKQSRTSLMTIVKK